MTRARAAGAACAAHSADALPSLMREQGARPREPLGRHTFVQVGGPADWFVRARGAAALIDVVCAARCAGAPLTILGAGSNVLIRDGGIRGIALRDDTRGYRRIGEDRVQVASGMRFAALARATARAGLAGLEWAAGIPGAIGGGLPTNAGAYGSQLSDVLISVDTIDPAGAAAAFDARDLDLGYRTSRLREGDLSDHVVISAVLQLRRGDPQQSLAEIDRVEALRKRNTPTGPSLGSTFKNPSRGARSAGQLIDQAGLKGTRIGSAQISRLHANYILNVDAPNARAAHFLALIARTQETVQRRFGIPLELEIAVIGEEPRDD